MSDKQKAIVALTFVSQTCTAAFSKLDQQHEPDPNTSDLAIVLNDLHSLLTLIYSLTTKLSLALKPSSPTYSASLPVLQDLAKYTSDIVHCISLLHGGTLIKDTTDIVKGIVDALHTLVQNFLDLASAPSVATAGEDYLVRTATLHDLITSAQGSTGIPKDNQSAVRKHWKCNKESLDDGLTEVARMIEEGDNDDQEDGFDDGWDELGLGGTNPMNKEELNRAKSVHQILRLTTLLHKRILLDLLSSTPPEPISNIAYDFLLMQSNLLLSTSDDLVATLYSPQEPASVHQEVVALMTIVTELHNQVQAFFPVVDVIQDGSKAGKKWFNTCK
ncbi:hypothetical protein V8B97DRAFT_1949784 [Scleroderma yunnanense]